LVSNQPPTQEPTDDCTNRAEHPGVPADARLDDAARRLDADRVVPEGDPVKDMKQFAAVKCSLRGGKVIFAT
jgi:hypothetical protein